MTVLIGFSKIFYTANALNFNKNQQTINAKI